MGNTTSDWVQLLASSQFSLYRFLSLRLLIIEEYGCNLFAIQDFQWEKFCPIGYHFQENSIGTGLPALPLANPDTTWYATMPYSANE
jgi:hypothetical protein